MITSLQSHIRSDISGYSYLIDLFHQAKKSNDKFITFNFENTWWFEANLAAVLGAILELLNNEGKIVDVTNINSKITNVMQRNHFLCEFGTPPIQDYNDTIVSYNKFSPSDDDAFMNYIKNELLSKRDFPKHSKRLGKKSVKVFLSSTKMPVLMGVVSRFIHAGSIIRTKSLND